MASYDAPYDREYSRRYRDPRDDRDSRYLDVRDYPKSHGHGHSRDLVPRAREDSDLSVEEVRRDFPPPTAREMRRARSAETSYYGDEYDYRRGHSSRYDRDYDDRRSRRHGGGSHYYEDEERRHKSKPMSKQDKIIAAVAGAALLAGGKEFYDRHEAKEEGGDVQRNPLSTAALAGFGALAAYQGAEYYSKQQAKKDQKANRILERGRDGYMSDDDEEDPREKKSHKNFLESAIAATGLGAAVKNFTGQGDDRKSDSRSHRSSPTASRSGSQGKGANKIQKAAMASLLAGATEAFRVAKEPGGWKGEKAKRVFTAAAGAATVDAAQSQDHGKLGLAESVIGGLVGNRLINGSRGDIEEDRKTGRSRSRSRARSRSRGRGGGGGGSSSGLAALATAGLGAFGAKKLYDHSQSRSRSRGRGRDDGDSRSPTPDRRRQRSRSRSVVDKARNSLAKLGIGAGAGAAADDHRRRDQDDFEEYGSRRPRRYSDEYEDSRRYDRDYDDDRSYRESEYERPRRRGGDSRSGYGSDTDLGDSSDDEKKAKKMKGKQILTTGLAAVASIHAAHEVYQSMEKRSARQKAVKEGRLSPAQAKKLKTKAIMQDAASVGIAALGVKSAYGELKSAKHMKDECKSFEAAKAERHARRIRRRRRRQQRGTRSASWSSRSPSPGEDDDDLDHGYGYYDEPGLEPRLVEEPERLARLPAPPGPFRGRIIR